MPADIIKRTNAAPTTIHSWKKPDLSSPCIVERSNGWLDGRTDREIRFWPIGKASFCSPTITSQESSPTDHRAGITARVTRSESKRLGVRTRALEISRKEFSCRKLWRAPHDHTLLGHGSDRPAIPSSRRRGIADLIWNLGRNDKFAAARAHAAHLQDGVFLDFDVVRNISWLGVEATGRQDLQLGVVKTLSVTGCEHARQDGDFTRIRMRVRGDPETFWKFETHRVGPGFGRIADKIELLQSWRGQGTLRHPLHCIRSQSHDTRDAGLRHRATWHQPGNDRQ